MARRGTKYELKKPRNDPSMKVKETNLPAKKYKHTNPTELRLSFEVSQQTGDYAWIDLAQCLSIVNRKHFRQHAYYYVQKVSLYDNETNFVDVNVAPDTYVTRNAVVRGKAIWDDMNERVAGKAGSILPKFHDYKVLLESRQANSDNLLPFGYAIETSAGPGIELPSGEWVYSTYVSADSDQDSTGDPDEFTAHILGSDTDTSRGLVRSYAKTRPMPQLEEPRIPGALETDDFLNIMDYSDEEQVNEILNNLDLHNDDHPYSQEFYIGEGHVQVLGQDWATQYSHVGRLATVQDSNRVATIGGFCAPFGLIGLDLSGITSTARIVIELAPGTYHGVYAERV